MKAMVMLLARLNSQLVTVSSDHMMQMNLNGKIEPRLLAALLSVC